MGGVCKEGFKRALVGRFMQMPYFSGKVIIMRLSRSYESNHKMFGYSVLPADALEDITTDVYRSYIRILYIPKGYKLSIDFDEYETDCPTLFFAGNNQKIQIKKAGKGDAHFIFYNRDFYCIQIHDAEVACDGILFNNIYNLPLTKLQGNENEVIAWLHDQIMTELTDMESSHEEMIRTYLKQLIIRATRMWKKQQLGKLNEEPAKEIEFFRDFSRLVDIHFKTKHAVADYADILGMAPKTLSAKLNRLDFASPNDIIKDRIVLEAKRLLCYSSFSVKEIAYQLGYDDPAYFNRMFTNKAGDTPHNFRKKYIQ